MYYFLVKSKINSVKRLPPIGIEPTKLNPRTVTPYIFIHSHELTTELTWQVLFEGYLTSLMLMQLTYGLR